MWFCGDEKNILDNRMGIKKQTLLIMSVFLISIFCLTGCGVLDFFKVSQSGPDMEEIIAETAEKEREQDAEASSDEAAPLESGGSQEYLDIEKNQVEEGTGNLSKSDLEIKREEIGLSAADIIGLQEAQAGNFYFEQLGSEERVLYVEFYQILVMQAEEILLSTTDTEILPRVYQCVINDHPEFFYLNGYTYTQYTRNDEVQYITFSGRYLYDEQEVARRQDAIDAAVEAKIDGLTGSDDYETVKLVYEDLILSTDYSMDSPDNQNICSVFLDKKSVCNGYAKAAQYLLNYLGIPCIIVNGTAGGSSHAWNIVEIGGAYYHMDVTWGDPSYYTSSADEKEGAPDIDYSYLCVTTAEISRNHRMDAEFAFPECTALSDNYFVREGLYLTAYDEGKIREIFDAARAQGSHNVVIKAAGEQVYQEIYRKLIDEQKIFDYFGTYQASGEYKIAYSGNEEMGTISFWE